MGVASEILDLVKQIAEWVREGVSDEDIAKRLEAPTEVGADLLAKAADRKKLGADLLGRDRD